MYARLHKAFAWTLEILFPPICAICERTSPDAADYFLCASCAAAIPLHDSLFCGECKARLPLPLLKTRRGETKFQSECHPKTSFLLAAATRYAHPAVRRLIWQLKYRRKPALAKPLAALLCQYVSVLPLPPYWTEGAMRPHSTSSVLVVPIPITHARFRNRGYNHAEEIARVVAHRFNLPLVPALLKTKDTKPQAELKEWNERVVNLAACFVVTDPASIKNKNILLVDDISTSGATLSEASRTLKSAGAKKIIGLVVAKAG